MTKNEIKARMILETSNGPDPITRVTAFANLEDMVKTCRAGYVPTIIPRKVRSNASVDTHLDELCKKMVIGALEALGLKVWQGRN